VPIRRAKSPESLYTEVEDHDLVITRDAALASAINRCIDRPHFGTFATIPRRLAAGRREQAEDRVAFLEVIEQTDHDWKAVAYAIGNVLQCWEHQGTLDAILEYDAYVDEATRDVVEIMRSLETTSQQLTAETIDEDTSVAVIGCEHLTNLERSILPDSFTRVDPYTDEVFDYPDFHIFESASDIISALLDTITAENAEHTAIVLDSGSQYSSLVESALEAADIPFYGGPGFIDDPHHRGFLRLLRLGFRGSETTVGDVQPVLTQMGIDVPISAREKHLDAVQIPAVDWLQRFCDTIDQHTFAEALDAYTAETGIDLELFAEELETLGIADETLTTDGIDRLSYYLQTYEVPVDRENEGVLLADAKSSAFVNRSTVFHVGMGEEWTHSAPKRPWVDTDSQFERYISDFQRLLQSGDQQYYLVQDSAGGEAITPCLYFGDLLDEDFESFSDLGFERYPRQTRSNGSTFDRASLDVESEHIETVSQSSLNSYVNSPRDYLFGKLLESPDQERLELGTLFHDFAEFYVNHPETVADTDTEAIVDAILEETKPFASEAEEPLRRREVRIGLDIITAYLDDHAPASEGFVTATSGWGENFFATYFGQPVDSPVTEHWFEDPSIGVKGKIDLVKAPDHILDYKSGHKKRSSQVVKRAAIGPPADTPNFQAALYLTYYRSVHPDEPLEFTFFHFLDPLEDVITGEADLEDALTTVSYYPHTFEEYVGSRDAYDALLDGYNDCQETFDDLGFEAYSDIMGQLAFPETIDRAELRASEFAEEFTAAVDVGTSEDVDAEKGADQAIRELNGVRKQAFFREDLDAFEGFLTERLDELNARRAGEERFPVEGLSGKPNYRRIDHRDCLLEGDAE
jgi:hypothetical protein